MDSKAGGENGKESIPDLGFYLRPAISTWGMGDEGPVGNWVETLPGRRAPHLCLPYILYVNLFLTPSFWGWAPHTPPFPHTFP